MPAKTSSLAAALKAEMTRLARREAKISLAPVAKASTARRQDVAALRKRLEAVERALKKLQRGHESVPLVGSGKNGEGRSEERQGRSAPRFRRDGLISLRKKLGLSADDFGALIGVSGASIYAWEAGDTLPRRAQLNKLIEIRGIGKRAAVARLREKGNGGIKAGERMLNRLGQHSQQ